MTIIVNIKKEKFDVYCGRGTIFGNPFKIGEDGTRDDVCEKYDAYFKKRILTDRVFRDRVLTLKDKILGCHCKPKRCHIETIIKYLENE